MLKFCGCKQCRTGMHASGWSKCVVRRAKRRMRRLTKAALRKGEEPPKALSVPYTD